MLSVVGFLIILGPLVIVHEFGHYLFAKIFGVRPEVFSIGFGPKLWSKQIGETEWRISSIPLGGYVKLLGEDSSAQLTPEQQQRALHKAKPWKRFFIFFGGPLFNFIWAAIVFMAIMAIGELQPASVVGRVVEHSAAERAGFQSGDRVLSIDGKPVKFFEDILNAISDHPDKPMNFEVVHPGSSNPLRIEVVPGKEEGFSVYGQPAPVGDIDGLLPAPRTTEVGVSDPGSPAGRAGLKTRDQITAFGGTPVSSWEELETRYRALAPGTSARLDVSRTGTAPFTLTFMKPADGTGASLVRVEDAWGLRSSELFVEKAIPQSPAEAAGLRPGDRLVAVDHQQVQSFFELRDAVQKGGEQGGKVALEWERDGKKIFASITPTATAGRDPLLKKTTQYTVGVAPMLAMGEPVKVIDRTLNPFVLVYRGFERMIIFSWRNLVSIGKMVTGDVSVKSLGGPIMIGKIAGESLAHGLISFLTTMAILSIGLGVLNVLPVPVLDGGHLLLLCVEIVRKKPLTMRQMEIIQGVGLSLILLLMAVVMRNDILRLPFFY